MKLLRLFTGSVGKKFLMAITGLLLSGFLVTHLAGNLLLLKGEHTFNAYAAALEGNPLLPLAEIALALIFIGHIVAGLKLAWENRLARPERYAVSASAGAKSLGSATMPYTGALLIVFLIVHLKTFRFADHGPSLYQHVLKAFSNPWYTGFYVLAMAGMVVHLSHGFQSAFQTLGFRHPQYTPTLQRFGYLFSVAMIAFAALSVWAYFGGMA
jgi:succinate dehydrogenase / fumarate reductase, cytochrome b subunit